MADFIHLHGHTTFSFLDGYGTPTQVVSRVKELGHDTCAVTDHGNVFAHVPHELACKKAGIKPIFGCEFYIVDDMEERTKYNPLLGAAGWPHVTVVALTQRGYKNLLQLHWESYQRGFYYKPRIDWQTLTKYQEGLAVLSGCVGGYPSRLLLTKGSEAAWDFIKARVAQIEHYYVELIPEPGLSSSENTIWDLVAIARDLKIPCIATADAHFPRAEDHDVQDLMLCVGIHKKLSDLDRQLRLPDYQYYCSREELLERFSNIPWPAKLSHEHHNIFLAYARQAMDNALSLGNMAQVEIPRATGVVYPGIPLEHTAESLLWKDVMGGMYQRHSQGLLPTEKWNDYYNRAYYEYDTIRRKGFCDYLLAIADVVRFIKQRGSLVVCRGSAGGSVLLWLLEASDTNPILHHLSFERFYDDSRPDPPDIDIDFERAFREVAITYIYERYGKENCSQLANLSQVKAKAALQDAAFALGINRQEYAPLSAALDSKDDEVDKQLNTITESAALRVLKRYPELRIINRMVGQYRQQSVHAAGILISPVPLAEIVGIVLGQNKQPVAAIDKKGAKELGFLKIDFLSVNALDIVAGAVRRLHKTMDFLRDLPLDDPATFQTARAGLLAGVFQLDGGSAARVSKEIGLDSFEDIYAASALCRPGPGDWVQTYKEHKQSPEKLRAYLTQFAPEAAAVVAPTYGILLYQEQVMALARQLAGLDWPDVHRLRKDVADKVGLDPQLGPPWRELWHSKFVGGCTSRGIRENEAEFWWRSIQTHGGYSFNKAHCVTYGIISYWMLYLKTHHPNQFYESYMQLEGDQLTIKKLIAEFRALGGEVKLLDPAYSEASFSLPKPGLLVGGYTNLKGIGEAKARTILFKGPFRDWPDLLKALMPAERSRIEATGYHTEDPSQYDVQAILALAPWLPVPAIGREEETTRCYHGIPLASKLPYGYPVEGNVCVAGYVTYLDIDHERLRFLIEDPGGAVLCRVPAKAVVSPLGVAVKELKHADFVAVSGWWTGEALFLKQVFLIKRKEVIDATAKRKGRDWSKSIKPSR